jgi:hypothetical protein
MKINLGCGTDIKQGCVNLLGDLHRILKPGGKIEARVPHFTSKNAYSDPTHRNFFTSDTLSYFTREHSRGYYFDFSFSQYDVRVEFDRRFPYNWLAEPLVNLSPRVINAWESSILRMFTAENLYVTLTR